MEQKRAITTASTYCSDTAPPFWSLLPRVGGNLMTFWVRNPTQGAFQLKFLSGNLEILTSLYKWLHPRPPHLTVVPDLTVTFATKWTQISTATLHNLMEWVKKTHVCVMARFLHTFGNIVYYQGVWYVSGGNPYTDIQYLIFTALVINCLYL